VNDLAAHPLKQLLDAGLVVTINSDDPAYFGGYLAANYQQTFAALGLDAGHAWQLARNSIDASFAPEPRKREWREALDQHFKQALHTSL
jgi:adenine deaminase